MRCTRDATGSARNRGDAQPPACAPMPTLCPPARSLTRQRSSSSSLEHSRTWGGEEWCKETESGAATRQQVMPRPSRTAACLQAFLCCAKPQPRRRTSAGSGCPGSASSAPSGCMRLQRGRRQGGGAHVSLGRGNTAPCACLFRAQCWHAGMLVWSAPLAMAGPPYQWVVADVAHLHQNCRAARGKECTQWSRVDGKALEWMLPCNAPPNPSTHRCSRP